MLILYCMIFEWFCKGPVRGFLHSGYQKLFWDPPWRRALSLTNDNPSEQKKAAPSGISEPFQEPNPTMLSCVLGAESIIDYR